MSYTVGVVGNDGRDKLKRVLHNQVGRWLKHFFLHTHCNIAMNMQFAYTSTNPQAKQHFTLDPDAPMRMFERRY